MSDITCGLCSKTEIGVYVLFSMFQVNAQIAESVINSEKHGKVTQMSEFIHKLTKTWKLHSDKQTLTSSKRTEL